MWSPTEHRLQGRGIERGDHSKVFNQNTDYEAWA